jgi:hypothetical protein
VEDGITGIPQEDGGKERIRDLKRSLNYFTMFESTWKRDFKNIPPFAYTFIYHP